MKNVQLHKMTDEEYFLFEEKSELRHELCIEPEQQVIVLYSKQEDGEWFAETLTKDEQVLSFSTLNISFNLKDIYNP